MEQKSRESFIGSTSRILSTTGDRQQFLTFDSNSEVIIGVRGERFETFLLVNNFEFTPKSLFHKIKIPSIQNVLSEMVLVIKLKGLDQVTINQFESTLREFDGSRTPFSMRMVALLLKKGLGLHIIGSTYEEETLHPYLEKILVNGLSYPNGRSVKMEVTLLRGESISNLLSEISDSEKKLSVQRNLSKFIHNNLSKISFTNSKRNMLFH